MSDHNRGGVVATLWRYPVKSMRGEQLSVAGVSEHGLTGDRAYAVADRTTGKIASAKHPAKWGRLLEIDAAYIESPDGRSIPPIRMTLPDGTTAHSKQADINDVLSAFLNRQVTLTNTRPDFPSVERIDPLDPDGPMMDTGPFMLPDRFTDYAPIHIVTNSTLRRFNELYSKARFDARRFRPNVVVDAEGTGFVENEWVGRTLSIGDDLRLRISDPSPRCSMPTLGQKDLSPDKAILRTIVEHNNIAVPVLDGAMLPCAGVYGFVINPGTIRAGDSVRIIE